MARKKKETGQTQAGGRPSDYDPIYCQMLIDHMSEGYSFESFAGKIGVCEKTLYNWEKEFSEFLHSKNIGKSKSRLVWEEKGITGLYNETIKDGDGMTVTRSINATLWIFNMKNRFGWRNNDEAVRLQVISPDQDRPLKHLTDEELDNL
jgi:hypothetical protein